MRNLTTNLLDDILRSDSLGHGERAYEMETSKGTVLAVREAGETFDHFVDAVFDEFGCSSVYSTEDVSGILDDLVPGDEQYDEDGVGTLEDGEYEYAKILVFVIDNLEYFEGARQLPVEAWDADDIGEVMFEACSTMRRIGTYRDCDSFMKLFDSDIVPVIWYVYRDSLAYEDCARYLLDMREDVYQVIGRRVVADVLKAKPEVLVGHVTYDGWAFPVYRMGDAYAIDLGGSVGMTDFIQFATQNEAFEAFEKAVMGEE